jgi:hypothetical protein
MSSKDVAKWMLEQVEASGSLTHQEAVRLIPQLFGERFIRLNAQGNRVIKKTVRVEFRKLAAGSVIWDPMHFRWRQKTGSESRTKLWTRNLLEHTL